MSALSFTNLLLLVFLFFFLVFFPAVRTGLEGPGLTIAQKFWYCISTVGGQYIWARLQSFSAFRRWGDSEQVPFQSFLCQLFSFLEELYF